MFLKIASSLFLLSNKTGSPSSWTLMTKFPSQILTTAPSVSSSLHKLLLLKLFLAKPPAHLKPSTEFLLPQVPEDQRTGIHLPHTHTGSFVMNSLATACHWQWMVTAGWGTRWGHVSWVWWTPSSIPCSWRERAYKGKSHFWQSHITYPTWSRLILQPGGRGRNLQLLIFRDFSIRHRKPGAGCVPVPMVQRSQAKQCRTAAVWMSPSCPPHLILLGSTMSHTHNASNTSTTQKKAEEDEWQSSPQHAGEAFWAGVASSGCALLPAPSISWTLQANQKDRMSSDCYKREMGLHYLVELVMKSSISAYPRAQEHSTYQSLANCLLLRSKNQLCVFVTWLMRRWPRGKGKHFPGKKLLTSEGRKPNSAPCASALHAKCSTRPVQAQWKEQAAVSCMFWGKHVFVPPDA